MVLVRTLSRVATPATTDLKVDLRKRQTNSVELASTLTGNSTNATASTSSAEVIETGMFTGVDGGTYDVTSVNGYVQVAGYSLTAGGPDALVGNGYVSQGSSEFVANGQPVELSTVTLSATPSMTAEPTASSTGDDRSSTGATDNTSLAVETAGSGVATSPAAASTSSEAAAPTQRAANGAVVAVGGLLGLMAL